MGGMSGWAVLLAEIMVGWMGGQLGRELVEQAAAPAASLYERDLQIAIREFWVGYPLGVLVGVLLTGGIAFLVTHHWNRFGWSALAAAGLVLVLAGVSMVVRSVFALAILYFGLPVWTALAFTLIGSKLNTGKWFPAA